MGGIGLGTEIPRRAEGYMFGIGDECLLVDIVLPTHCSGPLSQRVRGQPTVEFADYYGRVGSRGSILQDIGAGLYGLLKLVFLLCSFFPFFLYFPA